MVRNLGCHTLGSWFESRSNQLGNLVFLEILKNTPELMVVEDRDDCGTERIKGEDRDEILNFHQDQTLFKTC
jgi:hypothetical protein